MLIAFVGPRTRIRLWGPYRFDRGNGWLQEVPAAVAAEMLTHPGDQFGIAADEPLLGIVSCAEAGLLALAGVGSAQELAALNVAERKKVAREVGVTNRKVGGWMRKALAHIPPPPSPPLERGEGGLAKRA